MDIGTIIGFIVGGLLIFCAIVFGGHDGFASFWNVPALLIVFGCTAAAVLIAFPLKPILQSLASVKQCFAKSKTDPKEIISQIVFFSESVRRAGLLAQESRLDDVRDPFLAEGLHLIVDGLPPSTVENILNSEIEAIQHRNQRERNVLLHCGRCAPAFGMLGTIIGLVMMLAKLDAESVGPGMAVAVLTTFYGVLAAHLFFLPVAEKLWQLHEAEMQIKSMIVRGVLAIQSGEHPRIIRLKLQTLLPSEERPEDKQTWTHDMQTIALPMEEDVMETKQAA